MPRKPKETNKISANNSFEDFDNISENSNDSNIQKSKTITYINQPKREDATKPKIKQRTKEDIQDIDIVEEEKPEPKPKPKRQLNDVQKQNLQKGREKARLKLNERNEQINQKKNEMKEYKQHRKEQIANEELENFRKSLIKTAISEKKKYANANKVLDKMNDEPPKIIEKKIPPKQISVPNPQPLQIQQPQKSRFIYY